MSSDKSDKLDNILDKIFVSVMLTLAIIFIILLW